MPLSCKGASAIHKIISEASILLLSHSEQIFGSSARLIWLREVNRPDGPVDDVLAAYGAKSCGRRFASRMNCLTTLRPRTPCG